MATPEEKQQRWQEVAKKVRSIRDGLGMPIDRGIRETVIAFNALGVATRMSCQGHLRRVTHGPYIMFSSLKAKKYEQKCKELENKTSQDYKKASLIAKKFNLHERQKVLTWLDGFYATRNTPHSQRITIMEISHEISYLYCQSACLKPILSQYEKKQLLLANQSEMKAFTKYLKNKYFES